MKPKTVTNQKTIDELVENLDKRIEKGLENGIQFFSIDSFVACDECLYCIEHEDEDKWGDVCGMCSRLKEERILLQKIYELRRQSRLKQSNTIRER